MNILLSTDNNYVMPTGVLMHSISINNKDVLYYILVDEYFSNDSRDALTEIAIQYGNNISFFPVKMEMLKSLPFGREDQPKHVSMATYYRLFISEILPKEVHKIIYLDGDMIVRHSLEELWNIDLTNYAVGVVHDNDEEKHSARLPYTAEEGYFNAGMLLINLDYWREKNCFSTFMNFVENNQDIIKLHDQDVLNTIFHDKKKWLPMTYNFQTSYVLIPSWYECPERDKEEAEKTMLNPTIIHFASNDKPWKITCFHPYTAVWRYYWRRSQWRNERLIGEEPKNMKERIYMLALRYNLYMPKCQYKRCLLRK